MYSSATRKPITDSPWFWAYLFGTGAIVALALASPKFSARQAQIEREYQGRSRAAQNLNGVAPNLTMSTTQRTIVSLRPLFIVMAVMTAVAWLVFWVNRLRRNQSRGNDSDSVPKSFDQSAGQASNLGQP